MKQFELLKKYCEEQEIPFNEDVRNRFSVFQEMLIEKNKVMNLTAVTDPDQVELKHFIDSLAGVPFIQKKWKSHFANADGTMEENGKMEISIIDIGTGAGFPGLPMAFVLPNVRFVLTDSLNKRIGFIQDVVSTLGLSNVEAVAGRAEDLGQAGYREQFDFCVSRAVADMSVLLEYCLPFVKVGGYAILYKSGDYEEELEKSQYAMKLLGGELSEVNEFALGESDARRSLILVYKAMETPSKYPRRAGKPSKTPLVEQ